MTTGNTRRRVIAHGRVQGVFFRDSTEERARLAGLRGWVRNLADGTVEAVFEGGSASVDELVEFCRAGPRWAEVSRLEVFEEDPEGLPDFEVRVR